MKKILFTFAIILCTNILVAQSIPSIRNTDKSKEPISLCDFHISVFVIDNIATTTMEMQFHNTNDQVMEGEFNFPLANGVTISRFALDVNGEMREGVVVEKEKATQAFEAVTRKNVDPGLVEVTKGNNFKARVYPIPANGYKKAIIAFEQEINGDAKNYIYQLPINIKEKLHSFSVKVEVVKNKPVILKSNHPVINLNFTEARDSYISEFKQLNTSLDSHLTFAIPKPISKKLANTFSYQGTITADNYFYSDLAIKPEQRKKKKPKNISLIWDVSSSAKNRNLDKELKILAAYLEWMNKGQVKLITFSNTVHTTKEFKIIDGQNTTLFITLKSSSYDGGTNLNAIDFSKLNTDEIILFTDGVSNFGTNKNFNHKQPILAINSSNIANHNLLEHYANSSKGLYINAFQNSIKEVINLATQQQKQFIKAEFNPEEITELLPLEGEKVTDHFSVSGITKKESGKLMLHFGFGNEITETKTLIIKSAKHTTNGLGERIWAQKKLKTLVVDTNISAIKDHGKKFKLVTPYTSLIVLDNVEDYVQYKIVPPASLQEEYYKRINTREKENRRFKENRISKLCEDFNTDYKSWENAVDYRNKKMDAVESNKKPAHLSRLMAPPAPDVIEVVADEMEIEESVSQEYIVGNANRKEESKKRRKPKLTIIAWDSNAPYMDAIKSAHKKNIYKIYLTEKTTHKDNPSFYFDVATYMFQQSLKNEGLRVLSNLAELELENTELLRTLGRKLLEYKFYDEAITIFKEILETRSFEPHSYIDLGVAYAEKKEYQKAIDYLYKVIDKNWDADIISRFDGIELITLHDINAIIAKNDKKINTSFINSCFLKNMPVDVRIVIDWDANETDIDLWVTDPTKEKCSYSNKKTRIGGKISNDITQGYGPEEFTLKHAINGTYTIEAKFYSSRKQTITGNVTIRAFVYTNFGTKNEQKETLTLQVASQKGADYTIGEIEFSK